MPFWKWTCPHCEGAYYEHEKKHNLGRIASNHERRCNDRPKDKPAAINLDLEERPTAMDLHRMTGIDLLPKQRELMRNMQAGAFA